jgi:GNAT superfamily N-acetyltransferase
VAEDTSRVGLRAQPVRAGDEAALRRVRLAALRADPHAFSSTFEREHALPASHWASWALDSEVGATQRWFALLDRPAPGGDVDADWLGVAVVRADPDAAGVAVINAMWIAPEARRRGGTRVLCDAAADWATERGFEVIELAVLRGNEPALGAYRSNGFVMADDGDAQLHGCAADDLVMRRPLSPSR